MLNGPMACVACGGGIACPILVFMGPFAFKNFSLTLCSLKSKFPDLNFSFTKPPGELGSEKEPRKNLRPPKRNPPKRNHFFFGVVDTLPPQRTETKRWQPL